MFINNNMSSLSYQDLLLKFQELLCENNRLNSIISNLKKENDELKNNGLKLHIKNVEIDKNINIDPVIIKNTLSLNDISADVKLLFNYYNNDKNFFEPSIKYISPRKCVYWYNFKWINDLDYTHISNILTSNLYIAYIKVNNIDNMNSSNEFIENQKYISSIKTDKYKKKFIKVFKHMINLNSNSF